MFAGGVHFVDAREPELDSQRPAEAPKDAEIKPPRGVGLDLISLVSETPTGAEDRETQSSLLSEIVEIRDRAVAWHVEVMKARQAAAIVKRDELLKGCRVVEDEIKQLKWELGGLNSKLNDQGIARQEAQVRWETAKATFPESRFPNESEIQAKLEKEERARLALVTAQRNYAETNQQAANRQYKIDRKREELRGLENQLAFFDAQVNQTPYSDPKAPGLVSVPRL
jgi:chromosome segregation ATPase